MEKKKGKQRKSKKEKKKKKGKGKHVSLNTSTFLYMCWKLEGVAQLYSWSTPQLFYLIARRTENA